MLYLQQIVFTFILNTVLAETNEQRLLYRIELCIEYWVPEWTPPGFHKSIIPLLVSALQAGGSSVYGHTVQLPV